MVTIENVRAAENGAYQGATDTAGLAALNSVPVTLAHLLAARQILGGLAEGVGWDTDARRTALRTDLDESDAMIEAIDMRLLALRKWEDIHNPDRLLDQLHLMDAATVARLIETEHGIGFNDTSFGELVEFVADLPW